MASELEELASLVGSKNREINDLRDASRKEKEKYDRLSRSYDDARSEIAKLRKQVESPYNADTVKALMDAHEIIRGENKELHKRVDAAYAGVAIDASAKRHYLQAIIERLDGIKSSIEASLKD